MVMIDSLDHCEGSMARGRLLVREDNVFFRDGALSESGMIEALAQTAAARTSRMAGPGREGEERKAPVGVIGSISNFRLGFLPAAGQMIETEIEVVYEFMNASVVRGRVTVNGEEACTAEMKIFLTELA